MDPYCLVHAVERIPSGAYQYHPEEGVLERLGDTDRTTAGRLALDQPVVGDAAVNVYLMADVDAIVEALGGRGFTFYDDLVTDHLSPRAANRSPMTLFAFGRPE